MKKAFTLVEILVAISVISILAVSSIITLNNSRANSRDAKRLADIKQIQTALRMYYNDYKTYPSTAEWGTRLATGSNVYLDVIPQAPAVSEGDCGTSSRAYVYESDGKTYSLKFCTGNKVGDFVAGLKEATPDGIFIPLPPSCLALAEYQATSSSRLVLHLNGNSNDSTSNANNGTDTNISYVDTEMDKSASFNGVSSKIDFGQKASLNNVGTSDYTISLWIKPGTGMNSDRTIIRNWSLVEPKRQWNLSWTSTGKIYHYLYYTSSSWLLLQSTSTLSTGSWHSIIATRRSGAVSLYINGVLEASGTRSENLSNASNHTTIGYANPENGYFFSGLVDEVVVDHGKGWTASEVSNYYQTISPRISCLNP